MGIMKGAVDARECIVKSKTRISSGVVIRAMSLETPSAALAQLAPDVDKLIKPYSDFPKPGILFRDIMPLFTDMALVKRVCQSLAEHVRQQLPQDKQITAVCGLEARGFLFGPLIACELGASFVPIRKGGKLPGDVLAQTFTKEYGEDAFELQRGALTRADRVLLVDDLLATGGTLSAAVRLVDASGASTSLAFCLLELCQLGGRAAMPQQLGTPVLTLVKY